MVEVVQEAGWISAAIWGPRVMPRVVCSAIITRLVRFTLAAMVG